MKYLIKKVDENSRDVKSLRADMNKAKGGLGILIMLGGVLTGIYRWFE